MTEEKDVEGGRIKKLAEMRTLLEKRIKDAETELEGLHALFDVVNGILVDKGFKRADVQKAMPEPASVLEKEMPPPIPPEKVEETPPSAIVESEQAIPIKTVTGDMLANLYMSNEAIRVVLAEDKRFTVDVPPFMAFLVERVLAKMQEKDKEEAALGKLTPDQILSYEIVKDGDVLQEITIRNVGEDRARELKSTIRWTLEKMYERMRATT